MSRPNPIAPARHRGAVERQLVAEERLAAKGLEGRVLDPLGADLFVGQGLDVLEQVQARQSLCHQPGRQGRPAAVLLVKRPEGVFKPLPVNQLGQPDQFMPGIDHRFETHAEKIVSGECRGLREHGEPRVAGLTICGFRRSRSRKTLRARRRKIARFCRTAAENPAKTNTLKTKTSYDNQWVMSFSWATREAVLGDFGYVITEDGQLHKINALTGRVEASLAVTERYSMEGGSAVARPRLSASGDRVIVTDPARAQIHVVDRAKMQIVHKVAVPGAPFDVVVVGAAGENH